MQPFTNIRNMLAFVCCGGDFHSVSKTLTSSTGRFHFKVYWVLSFWHAGVVSWLISAILSLQSVTKDREIRICTIAKVSLAWVNCFPTIDDRLASALLCSVIFFIMTFPGLVLGTGFSTLVH